MPPTQERRGGIGGRRRRRPGRHEGAPQPPGARARGLGAGAAPVAKRESMRSGDACTRVVHPNASVHLLPDPCDVLVTPPTSMLWEAQAAARGAGGGRAVGAAAVPRAKAAAPVAPAPAAAPALPPDTPLQAPRRRTSSQPARPRRAWGSCRRRRRRAGRRRLTMCQTRQQRQLWWV